MSRAATATRRSGRSSAPRRRGSRTTDGGAAGRMAQARDVRRSDGPRPEPGGAMDPRTRRHQGRVARCGALPGVGRAPAPDGAGAYRRPGLARRKVCVSPISPGRDRTYGALAIQIGSTNLARAKEEHERRAQPEAGGQLVPVLARVDPVPRVLVEGLEQEVLYLPKPTVLQSACRASRSRSRGLRAAGVGASPPSLLRRSPVTTPRARRSRPGERGDEPELSRLHQSPMRRVRKPPRAAHRY
jgi:hypothetical protein